MYSTYLTDTKYLTHRDILYGFALLRQKAHWVSWKWHHSCTDSQRNSQSCM